MARNKHNVLHARSAPETDPKQLSRRAIVGFVPKTIDEKNRTVDFQLSSEAPVNVWDYERGDVVPEVLLSSGMRLPSNNQMPLLDTHDRSTIQKTHGSVRQIKIDGGNPVGKLFFARDDDSVDAFNKVTDGHITDGSVGYQVIRAFWIEEGQTMVFEGRTFAGPLKLSTEWLCKEFSLAPIGADENAKSRSDDAPPAKTDTPASTTKPSADRAESKTGGTFRMNPKLLALLISRGLAAGSTDEQALAFLSALPQADQDALRAEANKVESRNENLTELQKKQIREDAERATVQRIVDIEEACRTAGMDEAFTTKTKTEEKDINEARAAIFNELKKRNVQITSNNTVTGGDTDNQKFARAVADGVMVRCGVKPEKPAAGHEEFKGKTLLRIAEMCLERRGVNTRFMNKQQVAAAALRMKARGEYEIVGTSDDFTSIMLDASNKSLQRGFEEGPRQWRRFCSVGSAPDFKNINRIQLFGSQDLQVIDEAGNYTEAIIKDGKETYKLTSKGLRFTISRVAIIDDDAQAFSRIPRLLGVSATRTIERSAFGFLTGGLVTTMNDGKALFHADHENITTGSALGVDNLAADLVKMATQKGRGGEGSTTPAGVIPAILLVPWALKMAAESVCYDPVRPEATYGQAKNPIASQNISVVASPFLDLNSAKRRYLSADPNQADTIEISFLDGVEQPYMEEVDQTDADGRVYKIRIDVGGGVLDWRGLLTNAGE